MPANGHVMFEALVDLAFGLVDRYGVAVLLLVFVLEGALVGKVIPTRTLFVGVVLALGSGLFDYASVFAAAVVGATLGQLLLFLLVRHTAVDPTEVDRLPVTETTVARAEGWLDRWGLAAVAVSNVLPGARGWVTVPTAMADVPSYRFSAYSLAGSALYAGALVAVAVGIDLGVAVGLDAAADAGIDAVASVSDLVDL